MASRGGGLPGFASLREPSGWTVDIGRCSWGIEATGGEPSGCPFAPLREPSCWTQDGGPWTVAIVGEATGECLYTHGVYNYVIPALYLEL